MPPTSASPPPARPWPRAAGYLAVLGPFFFASYGLANWWTARLPQVGAVVFDWERRIPFWPWTIVPYMSLDALYAGSLFLCATRAELDTHARRLLAASVFSVAGFLLFPLRFSFERPATSGLSGWLFGVLAGLDKPYNQAPSLHISLALVVGLVYWRHLRGAARWAAAGWFGLIAGSIFTTYQHHFIDAVAGAAVGVVVVYLFPDGGWTAAPTAAPATTPTPAADAEPAAGLQRRLRRTLAARYGLGAVVYTTIAAAWGGWAWVLLWPGAALGLVALAYAGAGVAVFQKSASGRLSWAARLLLAPYRWAAWAASRWFTRHGPPSAEVAPGIWLGRAPGRPDWAHLPAGAVLDLTAEFSLSGTARARPHRAVPLLDLLPPTPAELAQAVAALDALLPHRPVLAHCALGYSRSAMVLAAWLLHSGQAVTPAAAVAQLRAARPQVLLSAAHWAALEAFHEQIKMG